MDIQRFKQKPVLGILRGSSADIVEPLIEAAVSSGLESLEITMNTAGAPELIRKAAKACASRLMLGAGTVLSLDSLKSALDNGATFIVSPVLIKEVAEHCRKNNIAFFPGALTPQEIYEAWQAGAAMVKVFPAKVFGPDYFREIKGPLEKIELLACSGVTPENLKDYFNAGASAVSFGASVFKKEWLQKGDLSSISGEIKKFIAAWNEFKVSRG